MPEYFYPDDININDVDGNRVARLGFSFECDAKGNVAITSDKLVDFTHDEIVTVYDAYKKVWLAARERHRKRENEVYFAILNYRHAFIAARTLELSGSECSMCEWGNYINLKIQEDDKRYWKLGSIESFVVSEYDKSAYISDRDSWNEFVNEGNEASITAWNKWKFTKSKKYQRY